MQNDLPTNKEELAKIGIFSPIIKMNKEDKNPYWVVSQQKILILDPDILPSSLLPNSPQNEKVSFLAWLLSKIWYFILGIFMPAPKISIRKSENVKSEIRYEFHWHFKEDRKRNVKFEIIRVSDCPNDFFEYCRPSVSVLVQWSSQQFSSPTGDLANFLGLISQADNIFFINPETNNQPSPPIASPATAQSLSPTDFKIFDVSNTNEISDKLFYEAMPSYHPEWPIVAVMDTGLVYKWETAEGGIERSYLRNEQETSFSIAKANSSGCLPGADFGYCGITHYLQRPLPTNSPVLAPLAAFTPAEILTSPFDDNLVNEVENGNPAQRKGRHGTIIAAILNHEECQVLPVKVFNIAGFGILFDILCGCNYVMSRKRSGTDIKVLNASFSGALNRRSVTVFYRKMRAITKIHNIWVVAAAGNGNLDLDAHPLYPAHFGKAGGVSKVITVTSAYSDGVTVGNFGTPVSIKAKSPLSDGFPSALPITNNDSIKGTSFAAPYAASVLAKSSVNTRSNALNHLRNTPVRSPLAKLVAPGTNDTNDIEFVDP